MLNTDFASTSFLQNTKNGDTTLLPNPTTGIRNKIKKIAVPKSFRLLDFHIYDENPTADDNLTSSSSSSSESSSSTNDDEEHTKNKIRKDKNVLKIQMFGINETGETCSLFVTNYKPFFYIKVGENWTQDTTNLLLADIRRKVGTYYETSILSGKLIKRQKLYGFSGGKEFNFVEITFKNVATMNRTKNLWYEYVPIDGINPENGVEKRKRDYIFPPFKQGSIDKLKLVLYESNIPPILRYFHINNISPSGWVSIPSNKIFKPATKSTTCTYEYICRVEDITPLPLKEDRVPYKICSFDIEASSSHGDFPIPKKTYKKLATNMVDYFEIYLKGISCGLIEKKETVSSSHTPVELSKQEKQNVSTIIKKIILSAFGYKPAFEKIDLVYPKEVNTKSYLLEKIQILLEKTIETVESENSSEEKKHLLKIDNLFNKLRNAESDNTECVEGDNEEEDITTSHIDFEEHDEDEEIRDTRLNRREPTPSKETTILDIIIQPIYKRDEKIQKINEVLTLLFPTLEGDKTTFIGSTFIKYGEQEPYLSHCIVLGSCAPVENVEILSVETERELLLSWTDLIQKENPDIIIGYNIFGFDYEFMFRRAEENGCEHDFLKLSRKKGEISAKQPRPIFSHFSPQSTANGSSFQQNQIPPQRSLCIENSKIVLASGEYDLKYFKMTGRLQIDMLYYFRRDFNLSSYKLDDVAGLYISDEIKKVVLGNTLPELRDSAERSIEEDHFDVACEGKTMELYSNNVTGLHVNDYIHIETTKFTTDYYKDGKKFKILDILKVEDNTKKTNKIIIQGYEPELLTMKGIKWCIAKDDVTPQDIFRLTNGTAEDRAIVAKYCIQDCNLVHHLMKKVDVFTGYVEMSSICSVPISFLVFRGQGIKLTSFVAKKCRDKNTLMPDIEKSNDNDGYEGAIVLPPKCGIYTDNPIACVDYSSLYPSSMISQNLSHDSKVWTKEYNLNGKLIRFIGDERYDNIEGYQYIDIEFDTYKYIRNPIKPSSKAEKTKVGKMICRWAQFPDNKKGIMPSILEELLKARASTRKLIKTEKDPFMQNILDKRQLGYKVTANSLYGQCGSRTSTFYEKDVAACTTATGRMMIIYAKNVIENVYGDSVYNTKSHGLVHTKAEYIYGDSVASYTPIFLRFTEGKNLGKLFICKIEDLVEKYKELLTGSTERKIEEEPFTVAHEGNWQTCKEPGKQEKEYFLFHKIETWTENGWTELKQIIRHKLDVNKKMVRVTTGYGLVDVTEDHSLIISNTKKEIRPRDCSVGTPLLHNYPPTQFNFDSTSFSQNSFSPKLNTEESINLPSQATANWSSSTLCSEESINYYQKYGYTNTQNYSINEAYDMGYKYGIYIVSTLHYEKFIFDSGDAYAKNVKYTEQNIEKIEEFLNNIITEFYEIRESFWKGVLTFLAEASPEKKINYSKQNVKEYPFTVACEEHPDVFTIVCRTQLEASLLCSLISSINYGICSIKNLNEINESSSTLYTDKSLKCKKNSKIENKYIVTIYKKNESDLEFSNEISDDVTFYCDSNQDKIVEITPIEYNGYVYDLTTENHHFAAGIGNMIVHNTDSVFFTFNLENTETKEKIRGKDALEITIEIAQDAAKLCSQWLKSPMELSYEKTLMPFILLSKKRYVGMLYETDPNKGYMKYMGLSIKRRDSCDYLKDVYGGILNILLNEHNILKSIEFLDESLTKLIDGNVSMEKLMISKSLRSDYKNPNQIAHKVLADRIAQREPGNKPKPGDRIRFVHFVNKNSNKPLQGEKIETPEFIINNKLTIDYSFYITNQLMKPIQQLYGLAVEQIMELRGSSTRQLKIELKELEKTCGDDLETFSKKREKMCSQRIKKILFDKYLTKIVNENNGFKFDILTYFTEKK